MYACIQMPPQARGIGDSGARLAGNCKTSQQECWELNSDPPQELNYLSSPSKFALLKKTKSITLYV